MGRRSAVVTAYIARARPFARPILARLRALVREGCPEVEETLKWGHPHFDHNGMLCGMAAFKAHVTFGFWKHDLLVEDSAGLPKARRDAWGTFGRLTSPEDLPPRTTMLALIRRAAKLNDEGARRPARARPKAPRPVAPPGYFLAALRGNRKALATFEGFSPSNQREYVEWVTEAKADETRERRLATAIEWMAEGRVRNWKYVRK